MYQWIVVEIGCIECGISSKIVGVFNSLKRAEDVAEILEETDKLHREGESQFKVFSLPQPEEIAAEYREYLETEVPDATHT